MTQRQVVIPYVARPQLEFVHERRARFQVVVAHRRAGKTYSVINQLIRAALTTSDRAGRFAYIAPTYKQAKSIAWDYLKYFTEPIPGRRVNESELKVDLPNGARIQLLGADNPDSLRGIYLHGCVVDEVGMMSAKIWGEILRPALSDKQGWAIFIGTPAGKNFFYELYTRGLKDADWCSNMLRASDSNIIPGHELEAMKREMSEAEYQQELECSFNAAIRGAYYAEDIAKAYMDSRVTTVPYDPSYPVYTAWDLGMRDATAIWFCQVTRFELRFIDYYEASGHGIDHYAGILKSKPYTYELAILPHDAENKVQAAAGRSIKSQLMGLGFKCSVAPSIRIYDGINAVRSILPKSVFDIQKCAKGLECLEHYRASFDESMGVNRQTPVHDNYSHGADAMRMLAIGLPKGAGRLDLDQTRALKQQSQTAIMNYDVFG